MKHFPRFLSRACSFSIVFFLLSTLIPGATFAASGEQYRRVEAHERATDLATAYFVAVPSQLSLEDCLDLAVEHNRNVIISKFRTKVAQEAGRQVSLSQRPSATLVVNETKLGEPSGSTGSSRQDVARLSLTENFAPFGKFHAQRLAARATIAAAKAEERRSAIDTCFNVTKAFYDLMLADEQIRVASESVSQLKKHRDHTDQLVQAGTAPRFDLLRAEVQLSSARPALIKAQHLRATTLADLLHLVGLDPASEPKTVGSFPTSISGLPHSEDEAVILASKERPDLEAAMAAEELSRRQISVARQALQPTVQITGMTEQTRGSRNPLTIYKDNWSVMAGLVFPVFDSGISKSQTRQAQAVLVQSVVNTENVLSAMRVDIRKALSGLAEAEEVLESQKKNVEQAEEALSIAQAAYGTGAKTALDVLDAELALTQARTLWYQALHDRAVAASQLEHSLGILPLQFRQTAVPKDEGTSLQTVPKKEAISPKTASKKDVTARKISLKKK
ncbi:MAG: TolC family protein [Candidatus Ozemobacteraceae bacterium]